MLSKEEQKRIIGLVQRSVHSRHRPQFGGYITFYGRNNNSPTGLTRIGSCPSTPEYEEMISQIDSRISPLSPTEGTRS